MFILLFGQGPGAVDTELPRSVTKPDVAYAIGNSMTRMPCHRTRVVRQGSRRQPSGRHGRQQDCVPPYAPGRLRHHCSMTLNVAARYAGGVLGQIRPTRTTMQALKLRPALTR